MPSSNAIALGALLLLSVARGAHAQAAARDVNGPIGAPDARIDSVFAFVRPEAPGCAVGVYREGRLAWARGYGLASIEHGVPIGPRTVFDLASTSKQFTAALVQLLAREGRLSLDDPVRRHLPQLPAWGDSVTLRQLVHHTAGVRDYLALMTLGGTRYTDVTTQADAVRTVARQRALDFAPGTDWGYSNSGYLLLAEVVAKVAGKPFAEVARERLFTPLGMTGTTLLRAHDDVVRGKASGYAPRAGGFAVSTSNFEQYGDGAVATSLEDLARWVANFERPTVGDSAFVRAMETPARLASGRVLEYASGLEVDATRGTRRVRHGGAWMGFRSDLVRFPDQRLAVAALCNRADAQPSALVDRVADRLLDDLRVPRASATVAQAARTGPPPGPSSRVVPGAGRYAGRWFAPRSGRELTLVARGDSLDIVTGSLSRPMRRLPDRSFDVDGGFGVLEFAAPAAGGEVPAFTLTLRQEGRPERYERVGTAELDAATRGALVGAWRSEELEVTWTFASDSAGNLVVQAPRRAPLRVRPIDANLLRVDRVLVRLQRDPAGALRAFTIDVDRARGIRFDRVR